jgi:hypothetical protein
MVVFGRSRREERAQVANVDVENFYGSAGTAPPKFFGSALRQVRTSELNFYHAVSSMLFVRQMRWVGLVVTCASSKMFPTRRRRLRIPLLSLFFTLFNTHG